MKHACGPKENREKRTENRKQKTENREHRTMNREPERMKLDLDDSKTEYFNVYKSLKDPDKVRKVPPYIQWKVRYII